MRNPLFPRAEPSLGGEPVEAAIAAALAADAPRTRVWLACSGGLDSMALLHAAVSILGRTFDFHVVHINHGLQPDAPAWVQRVRLAAAGLGIPCTVRDADIATGGTRGLEDAAREARYAVFSELLGSNEVILTAHHRDDQAETFLLQLLRGAGPRGLAAMRARRAFAGGWLVRPFLALPGSELKHYCAHHELDGVMDPSNEDRRFRRNLLRHEIIPIIERTWPATSEILARAAALQADANELIEAIGEDDLADVADDDCSTLRIGSLGKLSPPRAANVVRSWLARMGYGTPSRSQVASLLQAITSVRDDRELLMPAASALVRRYRGRLYLRPKEHGVAVGECEELAWNVPAPLVTPYGVLSARPSVGEGVSAAALRGKQVVVRWREGGERLRPRGRGVTKRVKALFQEAAIPPWQRPSYPLVYAGDELAAIPGICVAEQWSAGPDAPGWVLQWKAATQPLSRRS